jgi:hypothetical protein
MKVILRQNEMENATEFAKQNLSAKNLFDSGG